MRFFKTTIEIKYGWYNKVIPKDTILSSSKFYRCVVVISNGTQKTEFIYMDKGSLFDKLMMGEIRFLNAKELNKIKPHLKKEQLKHDL